MAPSDQHLSLFFLHSLNQVSPPVAAAEDLLDAAVKKIMECPHASLILIGQLQIPLAPLGGWGSPGEDYDMDSVVNCVFWLVTME